MASLRDLTIASLPAEVRTRIGDLRAAGLAIVDRGQIVEARRYSGALELRDSTDGPIQVVGYATSWDTSYPVYGGPEKGGWNEQVATGAATKSLRERDDVRWLINHDGLPLARTASGTLRLTADEIGLLSEILSLDMANPRAVELVSTLRRGDVDQMSFAFQATRQEWNEDYTERRILEVKLFDVSAVTYPANAATVVGLRADNQRADEKRRISLSLAKAQADALRLRGES